MVFRAQIKVTCREGVRDCEGNAISEALCRLDIAPVSRTRVGRWLEVDLESENERAAQDAVNEMCEKLLAHPVVEQYHFTLKEIG